MYLEGGYKTISLSTILSLSRLYDEKRLSLGAIRVYMALQEMKAIREASKQDFALYTREEIVKLTGLSLRSIGSSLSKLKQEGLISFSKRELTFFESECTHQEFSLRELKRFTPVPRRYLRLMAKEKKVSTIKTLLAYVVRGLYLKKNALNNKGTVKASWIARIFNLSLRAVKMARNVLYSLGIIKKDTTSYQRKLNRTGHYFILSTEIKKEGEKPGAPGYRAPVLRGNETSKKVRRRVGEPQKNLSRTSFAPPASKKCTNFAPPYKDNKTSYEVKTRKTASGLFTEGEPDIRDVKLIDIKKPSRLFALYQQAVGKGIIKASENALLNVFASAIRAGNTDLPDNRKVKVFMGLIRKNLWTHITQKEEDLARRALSKLRY